MKKTSFIFLFMLILTADGCSKKAATGNTENSENSSPSKSSGTAVDIDLTKMSATMIYSTVFEMVIDPDSYMDKVIKIKGIFRIFDNPNSGEPYFAVIIPDATQCCEQGLEFKWEGDHSYPADYPELEDEITVTGRFTVTEDNDGITYTYLRVSDLQINF